MNIDAVTRLLTGDEEKRYSPYDDATGKPIKQGDTIKGFVTIGVGINLSAGVDDAEVDFLLSHRIGKSVASLDKALPWWRFMSENRQQVIVSMCFNMGIGTTNSGLLSFRNTLASMQSGDYKKAAQGMRDSTWYKQVGKRAERLAKMMEEG